MRGFTFFDDLKMSWYRAMSNPEDKLSQSRRNIFFGSLFGATIADYLVSGVFYTTLILILFRGESETLRNEYIGRISIIQSVAAMMQIFSPLIMERLKRRKPFVMSLRVLYHTINIFGLAIVPILPIGVIAKANIFTAMMATMSLCLAMYSPGMNAWHMYFLKDNIRSDYFSINNIISKLVGNGVSLLSGMFMDLFTDGGNEYIAIVIMRGIAILLVAIETRSFWKVPEPTYEAVAEHPSIVQILTVPFRYPVFLFCAFISGMWSFSQSLGTVYYQPYLLTDAKMNYTFIGLTGIIGLPLSIYFVNFWNKQIHRFGWFPCMSLAIFLYGITFLFNGLVTEKTQILYIIGSVYCVMVAPGANMGISNLLYAYTPEGGKSSCVAFFSTLGSLLGLLSTWISKTFILKTEGIYLHIFGLTLKNGAYACFLATMSFTVLAGLSLILCRINKKDQRKKEAEEQKKL